MKLLLLAAIALLLMALLRENNEQVQAPGLR